MVSFDDPLNLEAAEHYQRDKVMLSITMTVLLVLLDAIFLALQVSFARKVQQFVRLYASSQPL